MPGRKPSDSAILGVDFAQGMYLDIVKNERIWRADRETSLQLVTEYLANAFSVSRASVWQLDGADTLECLDLCDTDNGLHCRGLKLSRDSYPEYFAALDQGRVIDAHDACSDPRTSRLSSEYLIPGRIGAMLDATIRSGGKLSGVLCLENTSGARLWVGKEKTAVQGVADLLSQLLLQHDLKYTVDRYESLLSHMPSVVFRCKYDANRTMEYVSLGISAITGYTVEDLVGNARCCYQDLIHSKDQSRVLQVIREAIEKRTDFDVAYRVTHKEDRVQWVRECGHACYDSKKEVAYIDGVITKLASENEFLLSDDERNEILPQISQCLSGATGDTFFKNLTENLANVLGVSYALIAKYVDESQEELVTVAVYGLSGHAENFSYSLKGTPCDDVINRGVCAYPSDVKNTFPDDKLLQEFEIESYLGTPLCAADGSVLGVMVVLGKTEITDMDLAVSLLQIFASRASAELERQISEQALVKSHLYYQKLFESAGDAIFLVQDGKFVDCNSSALKLFGGDRNDLMGQSPIELSPEVQPDGKASSDSASQKIGAALAGKTQHFEWRHSRLDGSVFDAEVTLSAFNTEGNDQMLGIVRDISERKRVDGLVDKQAEQLRASIESFPGIFYMFDKNGKVAHFNKAYLSYVGLTAEETRGLDGLEFIHPDDKVRAREAVNKVMTEGVTLQIELRFISNREEGQVVYLLASASRAFFDGEPYLVGAAFDIGKRVAAENRLEESQKTLQEHNKNLQIINSLSNKLIGLRTEDKVFDQAVASLSELPQAPLVMLVGIDPGQDYLQILKAGNVNKSFDFTSIKIPVSGSLAGIALKEKCVQVSENIATDERQSLDLRNAKCELLGVVSEVCFPLLDRGRPIGALTLAYRTPFSLSDPERQILESMVNNIATSITNVRYTNRLHFQAQHDSLTGLYNRSAFNHEIDKRLSELPQAEKQVAIMLIDLDRFKEVNDTLGHDIGDQLICDIGARIQKVGYNRQGFIARLGGDEFALLVDGGSDLSNIEQWAQNVLDVIREPLDIQGISLEVGASIGIALVPNEKVGREELMRRADVAMYHAKHESAGYFLYETGIDQNSREKLSLISELRTAIETDQFIMHFQPKVCLKSGDIVGFESLIRWLHPERGLIFPDEFIPLVEVGDLIHPLTELAIRKSLSQVSQWNRDYGKSFTIAVNISTRNLLDNSFPLALSALIRQSGISASLLELEITESTLISDPRRSLENLHAISSLGVQLSIDDFGTGYSSLAYLKQLPIQTLKIDRSFVMEMDKDKQDELIVNSTISLAHNLDLLVVAEGVESQEIEEKLASLGCDFAQGYHISKPAPPEQIEQFICSRVRQ